LAQTWPDKEVIVVDDGSTDGSLAIIRSFQDRVRIETGPNRGGNAARNRLLEMARAEWLQYLDADDYLLPKKISDQVQCLHSHPDADVIYSQVWVEDQAQAGAAPLRMVPLTEPHDPWIHLARWRLPQTGGSLWRKAAVTNAGGWNEAMSCCQEHELYLRLLESDAKFVHCPNGGAVYRLWITESVSRRDPLKVARTRLQVLEKMQETLAKQGGLSHERLHAINLTRFETARKFWGIEREEALHLMETVRRAEPEFRPEGPTAPQLYRWLYHVAGFDATERIAARLRRARPGAGRI
jgi:glycosyltransferase involved in cell wall biosynthesis